VLTGSLVKGIIECGSMQTSREVRFVPIATITLFRRTAT
jgi:hypothetical protein